MKQTLSWLWSGADAKYFDDHQRRCADASTPIRATALHDDYMPNFEDKNSYSIAIVATVPAQMAPVRGGPGWMLPSM